MSAKDHLHPGQLAMFVSPKEIVDTYIKSDSRGDSQGWSPREQWERDDEYNGGMSVREWKLRDLDSAMDSGDPEYVDTVANSGQPLEVTHTPRGPALTDGHHRLAWHEREGTPWLPVKHREQIDRAKTQWETTVMRALQNEKKR